MGIMHDAIKAVGHALENVHAGPQQLVWRKLVADRAPEITVKSVAFEPDSALPVSCTVDGVGSPPPLTWAHVPEQTRSVAVVCEDPDAPLPKPFVHWLVYDIPAQVNAIDADSSGACRLGENSKKATGFAPVAPPPGHGLHHYHFQVFALDTALDLAPGAGRAALVERMAGHVLAWGELVGTYQRD